MGPKGVHPTKQRLFISECWLAGMTKGEVLRHIQRLYGRKAAPAFVGMLWELRNEQMALWARPAKEPS